MTQRKKPKQPKRNDPISLAPLSVEEALRGLLATEPLEKKGTKKKRKKSRDTEE